MKIKCQTPKGVDVKEYKNRIDECLDNIVWEDETIDTSEIEWESKNDAQYVTGSWFKRQLKRLEQRYFGTIDSIHTFIPEEHWRNGERALWGFHLGYDYRDVQYTVTKLRENYDDTAVHETLHTLDDYIYIHLGIRVSSLFDRKDFDDVIHDREDELAELMKEVNPLLQQAINKDRKEEVTSLLYRTKREARRVITYLKSKIKGTKDYE